MMERKPLLSITLKDFQVTYFSGKGAGGQHRNRHKNCVRLYHPASGVTTIGQNARSKTQNLRDAFRRMALHRGFQAWLKRESYMVMVGYDFDEAVEKEMRPENLKIEGFNPETGEWEEI